MSEYLHSILIRPMPSGGSVGCTAEFGIRNEGAEWLLGIPSVLSNQLLIIPAGGSVIMYSGSGRKKCT